MVQGQIFLKWGLTLFLFNFFKIYYFFIYKLLWSLLIFAETKKDCLVGLGQEELA